MIAGLVDVDYTLLRAGGDGGGGPARSYRGGEQQPQQLLLRHDVRVNLLLAAASQRINCGQLPIRPQLAAAPAAAARRLPGRSSR